MIRIQRGEEPAELAAVRTRELPEIRAIATTRQPTQDDIGHQYKTTHDALWRAQHRKCCYCEHREQSRRNDVEHVRPKTRANRQPGSRDTHGYWWLSWTWENLLFSCRNCNQALAKSDQFPLDVGSEALQAEQMPPGQERPLIIDPATGSGIDHIQFAWTSIGLATVGRWMPRPRNRSRRGAWTIRVCQFDRPDMLDLYSDHVERNVKPRTDDIRTALQEGRILNVRREWSRALLTLLNPRQEYVGLSHDALDHFVPAVVRSKHQLELRLPST